MISMRVSWKRVAGAVVMLVSLGFLAALIRTQWAALQNYEWRLSPGWTLLSGALLLAASLVEIGVWRTILWRLGGRLPYAEAARVWYLSNIIRYIPGNIWQILGMTEMVAASGISRVITLTSIALHQLLSTAAGLVVAAVLMALTGKAEWVERLRPFLWLVPLGLLLLQPRLIERVLNWLLGKVGRPPVRIDLTWGQVWVIVLRYIVVWLLYGLAFAALVRGLTVYDIGWTPYVIASFALAYEAGYLSMLTPSGLGVREGIIVLLLSAFLPPPVAAVVSIIARLWMIAVELLCAGAALISRGRQARLSQG
jgi:glycosyltransferase 2 family protein